MSDDLADCNSDDPIKRIEQAHKKLADEQAKLRELGQQRNARIDTYHKLKDVWHKWIDKFEPYYGYHGLPDIDQYASPAIQAIDELANHVNADSAILDRWRIADLQWAFLTYCEPRQQNRPDTEISLDRGKFDYSVQIIEKALRQDSVESDVRAILENEKLHETFTWVIKLFGAIIGESRMERKVSNDEPRIVETIKPVEDKDPVIELLTPLEAVRRLRRAIENPIPFDGRPGKTRCNLSDDDAEAIRQSLWNAVNVSPDALPLGVEMKLRQLLDDLHNLLCCELEAPYCNHRRALNLVREVEAVLASAEQRPIAAPAAVADGTLPIGEKQESSPLDQLKPSDRKWYMLYKTTIEQHESELSGTTARAVYDWLKEHRDDVDSIAFSTFKTAISNGRNACGELRNSPRRGRTARSIVGIEELKELADN